MVRRGGRARLKASDSKSDRGASPSGVQILSPPPIFPGGVTERPKVRHWKCRARGEPLCRGFKSHPLRHSSEDLGVAVLDGELAVPCNPQPASAGSNSLPRAVRVE